MFKTFDSKITPFGGIQLIHKQLFSCGAGKFIDKHLGDRGLFSGYKYSELLLSRIYTAYCGGTATEDVNYIRQNTLQHLKGISIPSADTILRGDVELSTPCEQIATTSEKGNKININTRMNNFLVAGAVHFKQLDPEDENLVYDFDHQFIPTES